MLKKAIAGLPEKATSLSWTSCLCWCLGSQSPAHTEVLYLYLCCVCICLYLNLNLYLHFQASTSSSSSLCLPQLERAFSSGIIVTSFLSFISLLLSLQTLPVPTLLNLNLAVKRTTFVAQQVWWFLYSKCKAISK